MVRPLKRERQRGEKTKEVGKPRNPTNLTNHPRHFVECSALLSRGAGGRGGLDLVGNPMLGEVRLRGRPVGTIPGHMNLETGPKPRSLPWVLAVAPPPERWDDWGELGHAAWPEHVEKHYALIPTICFNCESTCGLVTYVDKETGPQ